MNQKSKPTHRDEAAVIRLSDFRGTANQPRETHHPAIHDRITATRRHIRRTLFDPGSPAVAAAAVYIDALGHIGMSATGIEPEMAASIADELRRLATTVEQHRHRERRPRKRERGGLSLAALIGISFIVATYINPIDWLDAALSIAAQASAALLARRPTHTGHQPAKKGRFKSLFKLPNSH
ncbi:hypothetical protein [Burkholderia cenocepacia]|uniref:hypothetical protein n=1 Tax=Burkholderia cenocepacia TaxID=95486 RepID=UPI002ABE8A67|nr:hypothetical protein [Burkholderia cenocepacia]